MKPVRPGDERLPDRSSTILRTREGPRIKKWLGAVVLLGWSIVPLRADVTVTQTMTSEWKASVLTPAGQLPKITIRIKGMKARTE